MDNICIYVFYVEQIVDLSLYINLPNTFSMAVLFYWSGVYVRSLDREGLRIRRKSKGMLHGAPLVAFKPACSVLLQNSD